MNVLHLILPTNRNWHEKHKLQYKICDVVNRAKIPQTSYFQSHLDVASDTGSVIFFLGILIVSKSTPFFTTPPKISGYFISTPKIVTP